MVYLLFIAGFFLVIYGANFLVDGAATIAKKFDVSAVVIGLTVVAFGTSAPELVVTILASISGKNDIAFGNVVGSNILNIFLILGSAAIVFPLTVQKNTVFKEIPLVLLSAILIFVMGSDWLIEREHVDCLDDLPDTGVKYVGALSRIDGFVLLSFFLVFIFYAFNAAKEGTLDIETGEIKEMGQGKATLFIILGMVGLTIGGRWIVDGASEIAVTAGLTEKFVGLTIVSLGTSLPELVTTLVAANKQQSDIAIGNVVGSNIFNTFLILGTGAFLSPISISPFGQNDMLVNIGGTLLLFMLLFIGKRHTIGRPEGIVFLLAYVAYTVYLVMRG
jgi:cation:H+ antiporter